MGRIVMDHGRSRGGQGVRKWAARGGKEVSGRPEGPGGPRDGCIIINLLGASRSCTRLCVCVHVDGMTPDWEDVWEPSWKLVWIISELVRVFV